MENEQKIFGKINDTKKDVVLSCRISKELNSLFKDHVDSLNEKIEDNNKKDKATVLKEIFLNHMENICYKRGTIDYKPVYIFLPKIKNTDNIKRDYGTTFHIFEYDEESETFNPLTDIKTLNDSIQPVGIYDYAKDFDRFDELENIMLMGRSNYPPEESIVVSFYLNNQLDFLEDGAYSRGIHNKYAHTGFLIVNYDDFIYYIRYIYIFKQGKADFRVAHLISNREAYKNAKECNNIDLAQIIDNYAEGLSNIENDISVLKSQKAYHQKQIKKINAQIKRLKK